MQVQSFGVPSYVVSQNYIILHVLKINDYLPSKLIPVTVLIIFFVVLYYFAACYKTRNSRNKKRPSLPEFSPKAWKLSTSYAELHTSTNGFSDENLIGSGSFGNVYRGILTSEGSIVAVKVLNLQQQGAFKSFTDECNALRSIRHRNLLKILSACSSIDHQGNDFKCLIFEFMSNGNLDQWLHPINEDQQYHTKRLNLVQRMDIAIDVASVLEYLHHNCVTPMVHCDLKPSNILLDDDMTAHVGDFGLARFLFERTSNSSTLSVGLKGSIGYIPPEYGMGGQVATLGDVYSYGILLLEMVTGKRPTDEMFKDGLNIYNFVATGLGEHVMDIVDPSLILVEEDEGEEEEKIYENEERAIMKHNYLRYKPIKMEECLVSMLKIGLSCSTSVASERMLINTVLNQMHAIKNSFLPNQV